MHEPTSRWLAIAAVLTLASGAGAQSDSPMLASDEARDTAADVVTVDTGRRGFPQSISIAPSALKTKPGLITMLPGPNTQLEEGAVMLTASGRPVFVLQGAIPAYRDLVPGIAGDDVRQLEQALARLGFHPGPIDGTFDSKTSTAVAGWYESAGWDPFGPTVAQLANIRTLEENMANAERKKLAAASAANAAAVAVESARATAEHATNAASAEVEARIAARDRSSADLANARLAVESARATADHLNKVATAERAAKAAGGTSLTVRSARAKAEHANKASKADVAAKTADRALIVMDPRQTKTARASAEAQLELARAAAENTRLQGEVAVQMAERDAKLAAEQSDLAEAAVKAAKLKGEVAVRAALNTQNAAKRDVKLAEGQIQLARDAARIKQLEGEAAVQAAIDAQKIAQLDVELAAIEADRIAGNLDNAKRKVGVQVPVDEIVFLPVLPVRVEQATVLVGDPANGPVMVVTDWSSSK